MAKHKTDKLYIALKKALAACGTDYERNSVQAVITNLRHECAWSDPESPLHPSDDGITSLA